MKTHEEETMNSHMDRAIFHLGASVTATSLYILICSLLDEGQLPMMDRIRVLWNGTQEDLSNSVEELISRGVLEPPPPWARDKEARLYLGRTWHRIVLPANSSPPLDTLVAGWLR
jgi:hypothetical protein